MNLFNKERLHKINTMNQYVFSKLNQKITVSFNVNTKLIFMRIVNKHGKGTTYVTPITTTNNVKYTNLSIKYLTGTVKFNPYPLKIFIEVATNEFEIYFADDSIPLHQTTRCGHYVSKFYLEPK